jgi:hypothetical protein
MSRLLYISRDNYFGHSDYQRLESSNSYDHTVFNEDPKTINNVLENTFNTSSVETGLMPPGVRAIFPGIVIFERPPTMKLVQHVNNTVSQLQTDPDDLDYDEDSGSYYDQEGNQVEYEDYVQNQVKDYYIPIPWQLYIATYSNLPSSKYYVNSVRMFFMNTSLHSPNVELYAPYIPNFYVNGLLCNPMLDSFDDINRYPKNVSGVIASAYDWVWNTGFNDDLNENIKLTITTNVNELCNLQLKQSFKHSHNFVGAFYDYISNFSLEDINSCSWLNPSYGAHHASDLNNNYFQEKYFNAFKKQYILEGNFDEGITIHSVEYREWLINNMSDFKKTYKDVLEYLRQTTSPFNYFNNQNSNLFNSFDDISDSLLSSISFHNSI